MYVKNFLEGLLSEKYPWTALTPFWRSSVFLESEKVKVILKKMASWKLSENCSQQVLRSYWDLK